MNIESFLPLLRLGNNENDRFSACVIVRFPTKSDTVTIVSLQLEAVAIWQSMHFVGGPHMSSNDSRFGGNVPKIAIAFVSTPLFGGFLLSVNAGRALNVSLIC